MEFIILLTLLIIVLTLFLVLTTPSVVNFLFPVQDEREACFDLENVEQSGSPQKA